MMLSGLIEILEIQLSEKREKVIKDEGSIVHIKRKIIVRGITNWKKNEMNRITQTTYLLIIYKVLKRNN